MRKHRYRNIIFALIPLLVFLALAELISRQFSFDYLMHYNPLTGRAIRNDTYLRIRELNDIFEDGSSFSPDPYNGIRAGENDNPLSKRPPRMPVATKTAGDIRIVCLGDSTTYNIFLPEEKSWPYLLERMLNEWSPKGEIYSVFNCATPGYGPQQCKRILQSRYIELEPDIVLWRERPMIDDLLELPRKRSLAGIRITQFFYRSNFIYLAAVGYRVALEHESLNNVLANLPTEAISGSEQFLFSSFVNWCQQRQVKSFVGVEYLNLTAETKLGQKLFGTHLDFKYFNHTSGTKQELKLDGNGSEWDKIQMPFVPGKEAFLAQQDSWLEMFADGCHFREKGAQLQAELVFEYLKANMDSSLIDKPALAYP